MVDHRTIQLLSCELSFMDVGGYGTSGHCDWRPNLLFLDSPICLNFHAGRNRQPCARCVLFQFVPEQRRAERVPCYYIELNEQGDTPAWLYRDGTQEELDAAVRDWLISSIQKLQREENGSERS